ncbi:alpha/beta hydrolase family protein [Saccharibacillus qingshengii]|uniref:alpha/beta hydrolase family protein n=1 Tax=Saccharibacillus qingshengii TaxID=1763540 RepID=UPI0015556816|nr:hypothetical protein [Saccharibacillus qingshengii]
MRSLEILLAVVNLAVLALMLWKKTRSIGWAAVGFSGSAAVLSAQVWLEGARWEMIPLYALTLLLAGMMLRRMWAGKESEAKKRRLGFRLLTGAAALLYGTAAVLLPVVLPVFKFVPLEGPYPVGTVTYAWTDESRPQVHTQEAAKRREILVRFWYPTDGSASAQAAPYIAHPRIFAEAFGRNEGVPSLLFDSMRLVRTHSQPAAPLSAAKHEYPVVIYSHGNRGWSGQSTFLTEQLASQGYIVVGIEHAGGTNATVFPDGEVMPFYADAGQKLDNGAFDRLADEVWVPDVKFVLDQLETIEGRNNGDAKPETGSADAKNGSPASLEAGSGVAEAAERFGGRLDTKRMGIVGYSMGGAAAVQALLSDDRLKAGIDMDGGFYGSLRAPNGIGRPFILIRADRTFRPDSMSDEALAQIGASRPEYDETVGELLERQAHAADGGNYVLTLKNTDHTSFSDAPLYSPLLSAASGLDARRAHEVIRVYTEAFFDKYLRGVEVELSALQAGTEGDHKLIQGQ